MTKENDWKLLPEDLAIILKLAFRVAMDAQLLPEVRAQARARRLFERIVEMFEQNNMVINHEISTRCLYSGHHNVLLCRTNQYEFEFMENGLSTFMRIKEIMRGELMDEKNPIEINQ